MNWARVARRIRVPLGFVVAAHSIWLGVALVAMFLLIYLPVIRSEEEFLRSTFEDFEQYTRQVPRLLPRFRLTGSTSGEFSMDLYRKHREYNALIGSAALY